MPQDAKAVMTIASQLSDRLRDEVRRLKGQQSLKRQQPPLRCTDDDNVSVIYDDSFEDEFNRVKQRDLKLHCNQSARIEDLQRNCSITDSFRNTYRDQDPPHASQISDRLRDEVRRLKDQQSLKRQRSPLICTDDDDDSVIYDDSFEDEYNRVEQRDLKRHCNQSTRIEDLQRNCSITDSFRNTYRDQDRNRERSQSRARVSGTSNEVSIRDQDRNRERSQSRARVSGTSNAVSIRDQDRNRERSQSRARVSTNHYRYR